MSKLALPCFLCLLLIHSSEELASIRRPRGKRLSKKAFVMQEQFRLLEEHAKAVAAGRQSILLGAVDPVASAVSSKITRKNKIKQRGNRKKGPPPKQDIRSKDIEDIAIMAPDAVEVKLTNGTTITVDPRGLHQKDSEDLWLAVRRSLAVTASEFSAVINASFFTSREALMEIKLGQRDAFKGNAACKWGLKVEPLGFQQYIDDTQFDTKETGLHIHPNGKYGASPDGLVVDADGTEGLLEIKSLYGQRNKLQMKQYDFCPRRYYDQIQGQLEICDKPWCDLMVWIPPNSKSKNYSILRVDRNQTHWDSVLAPALEEFCAEVETKQQELAQTTV